MSSCPTLDFWLPNEPLILASGSATRRALLRASGIRFEAIAPDVDERAVERLLFKSGASGGDVARALAIAKAEKVSVDRPDRIVLGSDQTLTLDDRRFSKPASRREAMEQLRALSGRTHMLNSAVAVCRDGNLIFEFVDVARLTMRDLSDDFIEAYVGAGGEYLFHSVGGYQIEGLGIQLFREMDGDYSTILGLPMIPILDFLRREGYLLA
jgi:septum formation protein